MRSTYRYDGEITLLSPLHHGGDTGSNVSPFRREKRIVADGTVKLMPFLSGNSLKHRVIREPGVTFMVEALGLEDGWLQDNREALHLLVCGGSMTKRGATIDLAAWRDLCALVPILGLCGGALGNHMEEGRLRVGDAIPICEDLLHVIPEVLRPGDGRPVHAVEDLMDLRFLVRNDPLRKPSSRRMLSAPAGDDALQGRLLEQREEANAGDHPQKRDSLQMIAHHEVMAAGTRLWWPLRAVDVSEMEHEALACAVARWKRDPYLGGRSAVGFGHADLILHGWEAINAFRPEERSVSRPLGQAYVTHLREHKGEIVRAMVAVK